MNLGFNIIRDEIEKQSISFARFMELALYAPEAGYYERHREIGRRGDFFTSVSVGDLFGTLLAFQFAEWLEFELRTDKSELRIVEAGAHGGKLAADILRALRANHPHVFSKLQYCILEPSAVHRQWQQQTLSEFHDNVRWFENWSDISRFSVLPSHFTIIFSNELLDAMPAHRIRWNRKERDWEEMKVGLKASVVTWLAENVSAETRKHLPVVPDELKAVLPDLFTTEISLAGMDWWDNAAKALHRGKLITIDYGLTAEEFFLPHRSNGTLRAYFRHHLSADLLARPGEQDITAHVNFSTLQKTGEAAGLKTCGLISQRKFLTDIAAKMWQSPEKFPWGKERTRQFQTLTHEEHLGRAFRVLIQESESR